MRKAVIYISIVCLFLLLFLPFIFTPGLFFPYITGKAFAFRLIVELLFVVWVAGAIFHKQLRPTKGSILYAFTGFMVVFLVANLFGVNFETSFWSNFERMEGYITYIHLFALFLVASSVLKDKKWWHYIFKTSIAFSIIVALHGVIQFLDAQQAGEVIRSSALFGNPIYLAEYVMVHIFMALYFARTSGPWMKTYYGVAIIINGIALLLTGTRGAVLGLIAGLIVTLVIVAFIDKEENTYRKFSIGALIAIILAGGLFFALRNTDFIQESKVLSRFANASLEERTAQARFANWSIAWDGFTERPILGWGQGNYNVVFDRGFNAPVLYDQEQWFDHVHNIILDMLVAGGVFGLLAYLSLIGTLLYVLWKDRELLTTQKAILTGLLVGYLVQNLFAFDNIVSYMLFVFLLAYIHGTNQTEHVGTEEELPETPHARMIVLVVGALILLGTMWGVNYRPYKANLSLIDGMRWVIPGEDGRQYVRHEDGGLAAFTQAYGYGTFGNPEITQQIFNAALMAQRNPQITEEYKRAFLALAFLAGQEAVEADPENSRPHYLFGGFLANLGDFNRAEAELQKVVELSPTRPSTRDLLSQVFLAQEKIAEAKQFAEETYNLAPAYNEGWQTYVITLYVSGDLQKYDALIQEARDTNQLDKLEFHYRKMMTIMEPNYVWHFLLAEIFINKGEMDKAQSVITEGIQKFPQHQSEFNKLQARMAGQGVF